MVTCQSANQLKTPAKVSWAFKMVSVWFTRLHNHGEDCWSDSCPEDNHWHPSQGEEDTNIHCCSQSAVSKHVNRELSGRKRCTTNRDKYTPMHVYIEGQYVMFIYYIYLYMKSSFPKRDKRQIYAILLCTEPIHCSINVSCQIAIFPCLKWTARCSSFPNRYKRRTCF